MYSSPTVTVIWLRLAFSTLTLVRTTPSGKLTVRLNGEADVLASIDKLVLATLHVDDLALHQQSSYVVTPPDGTWLVNGNEVAAVEITLEGISETVVTVNEAVFDKLPNGMYAAMPSGGLSVRLWGLSEEIEEITEENLRVTADMSAVTGPGTITVPVTVTVSGFSDVTVRGTYELTLTVTDTPPQAEPEGTPAGGDTGGATPAVSENTTTTTPAAPAA